MVKITALILIVLILEILSNGKISMFPVKYTNPFKKDFFENDAWHQNTVACGVDEVGRGPLAGPLVAAAVILFPQKNNDNLIDSKLLTEKKLLTAYKWIVQNSWYSYAITDHLTVDQQGIYNATLQCMQKAVIQTAYQCPKNIKTVLVDAMPLILPDRMKETDIFYFPYGEQKSRSIAAASIVAKVARDRIMKHYATLFPHYYFEKNKGYGTQEHLNALKQYGTSMIHRQSFLKNINSEKSNQLCFFGAKKHNELQK